MKKIFMLMAALAVTFIAKASDPDVTIADFNIAAGETKTLTLDLNNTGEMTAIQCDMYLPEGIEFTKLGAFDKARVEYDEDSDEYSHVKGAAKQEDGSIRFLIYSAAVKAFKGTSGAIVKFTVTASSTFDNTAPCTITIKNKEISATNAQAYYPEETETKVNNLSAVHGVAETTPASASDCKYIKDNEVIIVRNNKTYSVFGNVAK